MYYIITVFYINLYLITCIAEIHENFCDNILRIKHIYLINVAYEKTLFSIKVYKIISF